jgi:carboxyl-terminal processing protease
MHVNFRRQQLIHKGPRGATWLAMIAAILALLPAAGWTKADADAPTILASDSRHRQVARMVTRFVERQHYSRTRVDDALSATVLDNYLKSLDPGKQYFLEADIKYFSRYRQRIDDVLRDGDLEPVFDIFRLYRLRAQQNLSYALAALETEPDFTLDESYQFDREDLPWITTPGAMQDFWRRRVKNDALNLILTDKEWDEAAEVLTKRYEGLLKRVNKLDSDDVFETFMNSFARTLDPHSSYLSPRQSEEYRIQMSLSYQGIGASLQLEDDLVKVLNVIPGGPAALDGRIQADDRITAVGQGEEEELVDVVGWQLDDVVQLIRGPQGTGVRLQILPAGTMPGEEVIVELVRDKIKLEEQAASADTLELQRDGETVRLGVITVPSFYQDFEARNRGDKDYVSTTRDVERLIGELEAEGVDGLIMDLRGNGGGHLSEATALTGLFIDRGPVVQLKDTNGRIEVLEDPTPAAVYRGPMVVLVDRFSASASEIFAAAIQDYQRGIVIGQQTFGKGTVQNLYVLDQYVRRVPEEGLGQLTLTIGKYYRVTGGSTQHRGVLPDVDLPSLVDPETIGESSRERALPWDQIDPTGFDRTVQLQEYISELNRSQRERLVTDPNVRFLISDIEALEEVRAQKELSLNLETRRSEREARRQNQLDRENERRAALGLEPAADLKEVESEEREDVLKTQAGEVLLDLVNLADRPSMVSQATES